MCTDVQSGPEVSSMPLSQSCSTDPLTAQQREAEKPAALEACREDQALQQHELKWVKLPDLFVSFVSQRPKPNPDYEVIKKESEAWMKQVCRWTEKEYVKHICADFPYFVAVWSTEAGPDEFRTLCDWVNWVFDFDDLFDDGELNEHSENARKEIEAVTEIMSSPNPINYSAEQYPLRHVFQSIWQRIVKVFPGYNVPNPDIRMRLNCSTGAQRRFIKAMEFFFSGEVGQVDLRSSASTPDVETYLALRRKSIGAYPCFALVEYFHALDIPDEVFEHHSIREIEELAAEFVLLHNDILSFHKEHSMGVNHNIIHVFRQNGLSQQEAYEQVNALLNKRYRRWYLAHSELPVWGEEVDVQVQMYVKGCQDIILGNLNWSFKSERYFGKDNAVVRKTRMVTVVP